MSLLKHLSQFIVRMARVLADEEAYQRHLTAAGKAPSGIEWRRFMDAKLKRKYGNPKCC